MLISYCSLVEFRGDDVTTRTDQSDQSPVFLNDVGSDLQKEQSLTLVINGPRSRGVVVLCRVVARSCRLLPPRIWIRTPPLHLRQDLFIIVFAILLCQWHHIVGVLILLNQFQQSTISLTVIGVPGLNPKFSFLVSSCRSEPLDLDKKLENNNHRTLNCLQFYDNNPRHLRNSVVCFGAALKHRFRDPRDN